MPKFLAVLLFFLWGTFAQADEMSRVVSLQADSTALTIYPDNLALITETRTVDLPKGHSTIVFEGVSDRMVPASVLLRSFSGFTIERNFDYALLSKASLFEKSIGQMVTLTHTDKHSGDVRRHQAKIISAAQGVVFEVDGRIETLQCSGLSEGTRFENLPSGVNTVPELSIDVETQQAGPQTLVISYLADEFSWEADYRLDLDADTIGAEIGDVRGDFESWLTISNNTSQSFKNAPMAIIAGRLNRSRNTQAMERVSKPFYAQCWQMQSTQTPVPLPRNVYSEPNCGYGQGCGYRSESSYFSGGLADEIIVTASRQKNVMVYESAPMAPVREEDIGDYKLYRIANPVTLAAYQTKQIRFLKKPAVEAKKIHMFDVNLRGLRYVKEENKAAVKTTRIEYRLDNDKDGKLAKALPKGILRVFDQTKHQKKIVIGEADVRDTPIGVPMKIKLGESHLVQIQSRLTRKNSHRFGKDKTRRTEIWPVHIISNASDIAVLVEVKIDGRYKSLKLDHISHAMDKAEGPNTWTILVAANSTLNLKYRAQYFD